MFVQLYYARLVLSRLRQSWKIISDWIIFGVLWWLPKHCIIESLIHKSYNNFTLEASRNFEKAQHFFLHKQIGVSFCPFLSHFQSNFQKIYIQSTPETRHIIFTYVITHHTYVAFLVYVTKCLYKSSNYRSYIASPSSNKFLLPVLFVGVTLVWFGFISLRLRTFVL